MGIYNELDLLENEVAALKSENQTLIAENRELRAYKEQREYEDLCKKHNMIERD